MGVKAFFFVLVQSAWQQPQRGGGQVQKVRRLEHRSFEVAQHLRGGSQEAAIRGHSSSSTDTTETAGGDQGKKCVDENEIFLILTFKLWENIRGSQEKKSFI